jgi:ribonuclease HI
MYFDASACEDGCSIGILLVSPQGVMYSFSVRLPAPCTNNLAEYEVVHKGVELLLEASAEVVEVFGDSKLVISQLTEEYKCESVIPLSEKEGMKPPYVCPGCSNHTYSNSMITRIHVQ